MLLAAREKCRAALRDANAERNQRAASATARIMASSR
jgi:hypothetical protein